ncbi:MAG: DeoR/GlpR family DNA-binding transcription regulator [Spirochaetota bacterium]
MTKRIDRILKALSKDRRATVLELAEALGVSPATVRQDLTVLESEGLLRRVHGGAELNENDDLQHRMAVNYHEKLKIAKKAAEFVHDGDTIFVESGSSCALLVKELLPIRGLTVITSNAFIARSIDQSKGCTVVLIGGVFQKDSESLVGNLAKVCIERLNFDKAFLGIDGFTFETGITGRDMMRAEIAASIIAKSREVNILSDSSKFGRIGMSRYCSLDEIDRIITDDQLSEEFRKGLGDKLQLVMV